MRNFSQPGKVISHTEASAVASGQMVQIGALVGVACGAYEANQEGEYSLLGVYEFDKDGSLSLANGEAVGYDISAAAIVAQGDADSDFDAGFAVGTYAGSGETKVRVLLPLGGY